MKLSISNIALPAFEHDDFLPRLAMLGLSGLEVAPSRRWRNTWQELRATDGRARSSEKCDVPPAAPPGFPLANIIQLLSKHTCYPPGGEPWAGLSGNAFLEARYIYASRADAEQACLDAGCTGQAKSST